jgi:hypothetical protein
MGHTGECSLLLGELKEAETSMDNCASSIKCNKLSRNNFS